jgi:hypothetical protein
LVAGILGLINRIILQNRKPGETEREFLTRIALYEKCPGLIIDEEITRFNVCVECGVVTKNLSTNHRCQTKVRLSNSVADPNHLDADVDSFFFYLMRIRIRLFILIRIRIQILACK